MLARRLPALLLVLLCRAALPCVGSIAADLKLPASFAGDEAELAEMTPPRMKELGFTMGQRNRVVKWQKSRQAESAAGGQLPTLDYSLPSTRKLIRQRNMIIEGPIVVRNAVGGHMKYPMKLGEPGEFQRTLSQGLGKTIPSLKTSSTAMFANKVFSQEWPGKLRSWHKFKSGDPRHERTDEFFRTWETPGAPYKYWYKPMPDSMFGAKANPTREICKRLAFKEHARDCVQKATPGTIWANSHGLIAQAHFDRQLNLFLQVKGEKRFTFWEPEDVTKLCMYPFSHPGNRQSQADMGDGVGSKKCESYNRGVPNRTFTVGPGDVLMFPPYWAHRVDTLSASVSISYNYGSVSDPSLQMVENLLRLMEKISRAVHKRNLKGDKAAALLLAFTRAFLKATLQTDAKMQSWLTEHWQRSWETLPDVRTFGDGSGVQPLCDVERALPAKMRKHAQKLGSESGAWPAGLDPGVKAYRDSIVEIETGYALGTIMLWLSGDLVDARGSPVPTSARRPLVKLSHTKAWFLALGGCAKEQAHAEEL